MNYRFSSTLTYLSSDNFISWLFSAAWLGYVSPSNNNLGEWYTGYQWILCADYVVGFSRTGSYEWAKYPNPVLSYKRDIGRMGNYMAEEDVSNIMETTILESGKKAERMVKEHITTTTETGMKEGGGIVRNMDKEQCTSMETSI